MKTCGVNRDIATPFLILTLDGGDLSASRPSHFTSGTHCIGAWVGPRAGLGADLMVIKTYTCSARVSSETC
jgi:hypothetical protein